MDDTPDNDTPTVEWLTLPMAARRVGKSTRTIRRYIGDGKLLAQRATPSDQSAWLVSSVSLDETFGPAPEPVERITDDGSTVRSLVRQSDALLKLLAESDQRAREALERAVRAEVINEHLMARLRDQQPETLESQPKRKRWWQG